MTSGDIRQAQALFFDSIEIRANREGGISMSDKIAGAQVDVLYEIAAQLAEINENLKCPPRLIPLMNFDEGGRKL